MRTSTLPERNCQQRLDRSRLALVRLVDVVIIHAIHGHYLLSIAYYILYICVGCLCVLDAFVDLIDFSFVVD